MWRARCLETDTSGSAGGPGKPTGSNPGRAPRSDPTNLAGYVEKTVARHRECLRAPIATDPPAAPERAPELPELAAQAATEQFERRALVIRIRERYAAVQAMQAQGKGIKPIMRELGLAKETVRKYARAESVEELLAKSRDGRGTILAQFKAHLNGRWNEGVTNASELFREITALGYRGSLATVADYLRPFRTTGVAPAPQPNPPKVRQVASWLLSRREDLTAEELASLTEILDRCPPLAATAAHVNAFAEIMLHLRGQQLTAWIDAVETDDLPDLHSFSHGLRQDWDAVVNGLTLSHNSGAVEGHVNRIKMIKRQMYGRANLDLLRKRVLLAP